MKRCKVCRKKPGLERRINCKGIVFCSDDCYEEFDNSPNDFDHPYIDDYYRLEGNDGAFSMELYNYLLALVELHDLITNRQPNEIKEKYK